jgi:hypothetical protein
MTDQPASDPQKGTPPGPPPLPDNWSTMTAEEKFQYLAAGWASTKGKTFESQEIAESYQRRAQRWLDIVALKKPDRVPEYISTGEFGRKRAGLKPADTFYQPEKAANACIQFHEEYDYAYSAVTFGLSGKALEKIGYNLVRWPGSSLPSGLEEDLQFQYVESDYMKAEDYDELIANPDGFLLRKYVPRICSGLKGLELAPNLLNLVEIVSVTPTLMGFADGPLRQALESLLQAADHAAAHMQHFFSVRGQIQARFGAPTVWGSYTKAPFDHIGDTMRGTMEMMMDMYRRPDKVIAACEAITPMAIRLAVQTSLITQTPFVFIPLHKGADGFMSNEQFETFYWPSFKATLLGLIDAGLIPFSFVEGGYNQRLDIIAESGLPAGKTVWMFDRTDMKMAKEKIGKFACIGGNVPASLFSTGTPEMMEACCKDLIETAGSDGGYFLSPGAVLDLAKPENLQAFINSAKKFGVY